MLCHTCYQKKDCTKQEWFRWHFGVCVYNVWEWKKNDKIPAQLGAWYNQGNTSQDDMIGQLDPLWTMQFPILGKIQLTTMGRFPRLGYSAGFPPRIDACEIFLFASTNKVLSFFTSICRCGCFNLTANSLIFVGFCLVCRSSSQIMI